MFLTIQMSKQFFNWKMFYIVYIGFLLTGLVSQFCKKNVSVLKMISHSGQSVFYIYCMFCTLILSCYKKLLEAVVLQNRMLLFSVFLCLFFSVLLSFLIKQCDLPHPVHRFRLFVSCYWRSIHLIYVIFPLHTFKQYCFFLYPGTML